MQTGSCFFGTTKSRTISINLKAFDIKYAFDAKYSEALLDEKTSKETKALILSAMQDRMAREFKELELASLKKVTDAEKDYLIKVTDAEKDSLIKVTDAEKEVLRLLLKLEKANHEIDEATGKFNKLVPRSIIGTVTREE
jgi:hypothetical protein